MIRVFWTMYFYNCTVTRSTNVNWSRVLLCIHFCLNEWHCVWLFDFRHRIIKIFSWCVSISTHCVKTRTGYLHRKWWHQIPWNYCQMINVMEIMQFDSVLKNKCYGFPQHCVWHPGTRAKFFTTLSWWWWCILLECSHAHSYQFIFVQWGF